MREPLVPHDVELAAVQAFIDAAVLGHSVRISLHWRLHKSVVGKHSVVAILTALSVHQGQPVWGVHVMHAVCTAIFWEGNRFCVLFCFPCNSRCACGGMTTAENACPPSNLWW